MESQIAYDSCPNSRFGFEHYFRWSMDLQKTVCIGCGREQSTLNELEDWEAKR